MRYLAALLLAATPAFAGELPAIDRQDRRFEAIGYLVGERFSLPTADQIVQTVLFESGERIESVKVSDPGAYAISILDSGEALTVQPKVLAATTMLSVRTTRHSYEFDLAPAQDQDVPLVVRVSASASDAGADQHLGQAAAPCPDGRDPPCAAPGRGAYRMSGDTSVRPFSISDDGVRTFIAFGEDQAIPAVFAIGPSGKEEMVDGYIRGGIYTLDRVYNDLVFRIDEDAAKARRVIKRDGR